MECVTQKEWIKVSGQDFSDVSVGMHHGKTVLKAPLPNALQIGENREKGVVLIIALILMGVIAISSAMVMKSALSGDLIAQNLRAKNIAFENAETARVWCTHLAYQPSAAASAPIIKGWDNLDGWNEDALPETADPHPTEENANRWQTSTNWVDNAEGFHRVDLTNMSANLEGGQGLSRQAFMGQRAPECMLEAYSIPKLNPGGGAAAGRTTYQRVLLVTARGFSPDFSDAAGNRRGSQVMVQERVLFEK